MGRQTHVLVIIFTLFWKWNFDSLAQILAVRVRVYQGRHAVAVAIAVGEARVAVRKAVAH